MTIKRSALCGVAIFLLLSFLSTVPSPVRGEKEAATYDLPQALPEAHLRALKKAGWNDEKVQRLSAVYRIYRRAYAFVLLPKPVPGAHLLILAEWANVITGNKVDPYLTAGIHPQEVYHDVDIGKCSFYGTEAARTTDEREETDGEKKKRESFEREKQAFGMIIADIKKNPRWRTLDPAHPAVACAGGDVGSFQMRPTTWLHYRDRVLALLKLKTASPYELIPAVFAVNLILNDKIRHLKLPIPAREVTLANSLYFAKVATAYNKGAEGVNSNGGCITRYGEEVYRTALKLKKIEDAEAAKKARARTK